MSVRLAPAVHEAIRRASAAAYPNEGCGALLGPSSGEIVETIPLDNKEEASPRVRFAVSPRDYIRVEAEAERKGLVLVGFWHSHPDHPARPSPTDRQYAWEGLLTMVIAVAKGEPGELTAWEVRGAGTPFEPVTIENRGGTPCP